MSQPLTDAAPGSLSPASSRNDTHEGSVGVSLLPCPFCGGEARSHLYVRDGSKVQCTNYRCQGATTAHNPNAVEKAIAAWNTRTPSPSTAALVEALDKCRAIIKFHCKPEKCCSFNGGADVFSALEAYELAVSALAAHREGAAK